MEKINMKTSKGQALLFTVVAVTISLAIGVTVATRNLGSISRITRSDTASKAYAAAEGGIERLQVLTDAQRDALVGTGSSKCTDNGFQNPETADGTCVLAFPTESAGFRSVAVLKVEKFTYTNIAGSYYGFHLEPGITKEVAVSGYTPSSVTLCWDKSGLGDSALYYYSYNFEGKIRRGGFRPVGFVHSSDTVGYLDIVRRVPTTNNPFYYCGYAYLMGTPYGLRIKSLYEATDAAIYTRSGGILPEQGYLLTSVGRIEQEGQVKETKKVKLYRSLSYMPPFFDYAIFNATGQVD